MAQLPSHLELVQGVVLPKPVGGDAVLDFCNTRAGWVGRGPARTDWLASYEALLVWAGYRGLLSDETAARLAARAAAEPAEAARRYDEALGFRTDLYDVLTDAAASGAFEAAGAVVERAHARRRLVAVPAASDGGDAAQVLAGSGVGVGWELPEDLGLPLNRIAVLAGELLTDDVRRGSIRLCPGDSCGWLFLDTRGRRRWCSMATCGNRAKVRAHAARTQG